MSEKPNILFIMADQLRYDYLSCYGHPHLKTPNIDRLAKNGVRFTRAYAQSPVCGPSRMSFYTGRYVRNHGSTFNNVPLRAGEMTMGDHLREAGMNAYLLGKTHMTADQKGFDRLDLSRSTTTGERIAQCGFDVIEREEGVYPEPQDKEIHYTSAYNEYLRANGYDGPNPWHDWVNSVEIDNEVISGWYLDYVDQPARAKEEHTETPYLTQKAIEAIDHFEEDGWCLHLSYIKPHWPYLAPAPYHNLYSEEHIQAPIRNDEERTNAHPVYHAYQQLRVSQSFSDDDIRKKVIPAYMGLIKQLDDQLGILFDALEERNLLDNTIIVFTSDHGDYMGDHWLGEKDFAHEQAVRIPLIISDPREIADKTRGSTCDLLVESIDLASTFVDIAEGDTESPWLQGKSLMPVLSGQKIDDWRNVVFSEYDYSTQAVRENVGADIDEAFYITVISEQHKLVYFPNFRPILFDLNKDPHELEDVSQVADYKDILDDLMRKMTRWLSLPNRVTESRQSRYKRTNTQVQRGLWVGVKNAQDHQSALEAETR